MGHGFILDALEVGIATYNSLHNTDFKKADCTFGEPKDLNVLAGGVVNPSKRNTAVACTHNPTGKAFTLYYDRYSIAKYTTAYLAPQFVFIYLLNDADGDLKKLANSITHFQGIKLEERDIVSGAFDAVAKPAANTIYGITIASTSYNFLPGETFQFTILGKYYKANGKVFLIKDSGLKPDIWYEDRQNDTSVSGTRGALPSILTYEHDYTPIRRFLRRLNGYSTYATGSNLNYSYSLGEWFTLLLKAMTAIDGVPWTYGNGTTNTAYGLQYAWVVYNGPTRLDRGLNSQQYRVPAAYLNMIQAANREYDNVAILFVEYATNLERSCLMLHYNDA